MRIFFRNSKNYMPVITSDADNLSGEPGIEIDELFRGVAYYCGMTGVDSFETFVGEVVGQKQSINILQRLLIDLKKEVDEIKESKPSTTESVVKRKQIELAIAGGSDERVDSTAEK